MHPITLRPSLRFSSIIPVYQVYDETRGRDLDKSDGTERALADEAVDHMEVLVQGKFPYSRFKAPAHQDVAGQQALINEASTYRTRVLDRLRLIDADFANDPHQRLAALSSQGDFVLLTGDDAQPTLDADRLQDTVLDRVGTDAMATRTQAEKDADTRALEAADAIYTREEARIGEHSRTAARRVRLHVIAIPGGQSFWGQVGASMLGVPAITIIDMTVC